MHSTLIQDLRERLRDPKRAVDESLGQLRQFEPVEPGWIDRAEQLLGFRLPPLLRALYAEVANGGFGPGYGLLELPRNEPGCHDLVGMYWYLCGDPRQPSPDVHLNASLVADLPTESEDMAEEAPTVAWDWPRHLLPVFGHGNAAYECIDWSRSEAPMWLHEPDALAAGNTMADTLVELAPSLEARLRA